MCDHTCNIVILPCYGRPRDISFVPVYLYFAKICPWMFLQIYSKWDKRLSMRVAHVIMIIRYKINVWLKVSFKYIKIYLYLKIVKSQRFLAVSIIRIIIIIFFLNIIVAIFLPHIMFRVWWLIKNTKSSIHVLFISLIDFAIWLLSSIKTLQKGFSMLKWNAGVNIFRLSCHFSPENQNF